MVICEIAEKVTTPIESVLRNYDLGWTWGIASLLFFFFAMIGSVLLLEKTVWPRWLPSYLYVRTSLFIPITIQEAKKLSFLFDGTLDGKWFPASALRAIEREYRKDALLRFANKIARSYKFKAPFTMPEDTERHSTNRNEQRTSSSNESGTKSDPGPKPEPSREELCLRLLKIYEKPKNFEEIKSAYRKMIRQYHPDKFVGSSCELINHAEEMAKQVNLAYAYLDKSYGRGSTL